MNPFPPDPNRLAPIDCGPDIMKDGNEAANPLLGVNEGRVGTPAIPGTAVEARNGFDAPPPVICGLNP